MNLAVSHDVLCKWLGTPTVIIISHHLEMTFGIAVHGIANQDQLLFFADMRCGLL